MSVLRIELDRLFRIVPRQGATADNASAADPAGLVGAGAMVRALVLEVGAPAEWKTIAPVWQGVQADLEFPAPAIAVTGKDAFQIWFSVAEPVPAAQALGLLQGLRNRYLSDIKPERVRLYPAMLQDGAASEWRHATPGPVLMPDTGKWSAFLAPDLASIFSDEPWLDREPNPEAQANLLARITGMGLDVFEATLVQLGQSATAFVTGSAEQPNSHPSPLTATVSVPTPHENSPQRFLLQVMNDPGVPMHLRIDAAKALLSHMPGNSH